MQKLAHYEIETLIGEGGFAQVYRAFDPNLNRRVALKVLKSFWLNDPDAVDRFRQEAQQMANLHHPNIVTVYEVRQAGKEVFLAQFLVEGESLAEKLKRGPLSWREALALLHPLAEALDYAHGRGLVHRDVKPANILLDYEGCLYLSDFGLVQAAAESASISASIGGVVGTPHCMAPEQWEGQPASPATDVYALACVVFEMLTGSPLFEGSTSVAVMTRHLVNRPELPKSWPSEIPVGLNAVLEKGLALDPEERLAKATTLFEMLKDLETPSPEPPPEPPQWWKTWRGGAVLAAALVMVFLAIWIFSGGDSPAPVDPPTYDQAWGNIFFASDHLLKGQGSQLVSIADTDDKRRHLIVEGRSGSIQVVSASADDRFWLGLSGDGLDVGNNGEWLRYVFDGGAEANYIQTIEYDDRGGIWIGARQSGAYFDGQRWRPFAADSGLADKDIRAIKITDDGTVWFGAWGSGIISWKDGTRAEFSMGDREGWNQVTALQPLEDDLWIGTSAGLAKFNQSNLTIERFTTADGLPEDFVTALTADPTGALWIGTWGGGVARLKDGLFQVFTFDLDRFNYVVNLTAGGLKIWVLSPEGVMVRDLQTGNWEAF